MLSKSLAVGVMLISMTVHPAWSEEFFGTVIGVSDGDTITVLRSGRPERVRLQGIDCPEKRQAYGNRAKQYCSSLAFRQNVHVIVSTNDKYGRSVAEVVLPDNRSLNKELVASGMAWWYRKYSSDAKLAALEEAARRCRRGLWADSSAIPPWDFRAIANHGTPRPSTVLFKVTQR
jgi:endonuclease YncB( thermonuclease family)